MPETLGLIAAKGTSRRLPRKNVRELGGKPLVVHAIADARAAERINRVVVSSENETIRRVARAHGAEVPFERPAELARDDATTHDVVEHALEWFEERGQTFDIVCAIPVTSPFRVAADIDGALGRLVKTGADSVLSVSEYDTPPFSAVKDVDGWVRPYFEETNLWTETQSENVPTLYHPSGAVFAATIDGFRSASGFYTDDTVGYTMPQERSLDIDEPHDLRVARALWRDGGVSQ